MAKLSKAVRTLIEAAGIDVANDETGKIVWMDGERTLLVTDKATKADAEAAVAAKEAADEADGTKSVVAENYKELYKLRGDANSCGDGVAELMKAATTGADGKCDIDELRLVAAANGLEERLDGYLAAGRNIGMCRMNIGNILRGMVNRGEPVVIDGRNVVDADIGAAA